MRRDGVRYSLRIFRWTERAVDVRLNTRVCALVARLLLSDGIGGPLLASHAIEQKLIVLALQHEHPRVQPVDRNTVARTCRFQRASAADAGIPTSIPRMNELRCDHNLASE